jgi:hypothetical protein
MKTIGETMSEIWRCGMRIHNPVKGNKSKTSSLDGQMHGGTMESADQFANLINGAVSNIGNDDNNQSNKQTKK